MKNKKIYTGALALTITLGAVTTVQQGTLPIYAKETTKDVASQEFLDYIKDLKRKYPDFKFIENVKVYNSVEEAQNAEKAQKKQIEQSVKKYEETKKNKKAEYDQKVEQYQRDLAEYNQKKQEYEAKKAEFENKKTEEGQLTEVLAQNLIFKNEPNAEVSISGRFQGYWKRADNKYGNDYGNVDYKPENGDTIEQSWTGGYANWKAGNDPFLGYPIVLGQGDVVTATYTNLQNTSYAGKKVSKIEYIISSNQTQPHSVFVLKNPTLGIWTYNTKEGNNTVQTNLTIKFYDEYGRLIEFDRNHPALVNLGSLNSGTTARGYRYIEKVNNYNFRFVYINGSLVKETANREIYAAEQDTDNPTNYKGWDSTKWDRVGNPNMWFGSGVGVATSGNAIRLSAESNANGQWLIVNSAVTTKDTLPPFTVDNPEDPGVYNEPPYPGNNGTSNTITYNRALVKELTTSWVDKDGKELKPPVTDTSIHPAGDISHYVFDHDDVDNDGNVKHVYKQLETRWVDRDGKQLKDPVKDGSIQDKGTIDNYAFVETKTEGDVTTHIFRQFNTKWVDEEGKDIKPEFTGDAAKDKEDFDDYAFVNTENVDGNLVHHYRQFITEWVDREGKPLKDKVITKAIQESGTIPSYSFVETKTDEKGNVKHIFRQYTTKWVDEDGKDIKPEFIGDKPQDKADFDDYAFVKTDENDGNQVHHYRQFITEWVTRDGTPLKDKVVTKEIKESGEIPNYHFLETKTDEKGNVKHIFRQFKTRWVDEEGHDIKQAFVGDKPQDRADLDDYAYLSTETIDGNPIHHYRQFTTEWITEDGLALKDKVVTKEIKESGTIPDYKFLETKTDENGNVKHIFVQFTTTWVDEKGKNIEKPAKTDEFMKEKEFKGYKLIDKKEEGRTKTYIYHKIITTWVEEDTNKQLKQQEGIFEHGDINSYTYVRTETKENGDIVHVFKKVAKNDIPTGVNNNIFTSLFMLLTGLGGLIILNLKKLKHKGD